MIKYYAMKTHTGEWYLVEDHSSMFASPTWLLNFGGKKHKISLLVHRAIFQQYHNLQGLSDAVRQAISEKRQISIPFRPERGITATHHIKTAGQFDNHSIICLNYNISKPEDLMDVGRHFEFATGPIVEIIAFK